MTAVSNVISRFLGNNDVPQLTISSYENGNHSQTQHHSVGN